MIEFVGTGRDVTRGPNQTLREGKQKQSACDSRKRRFDQRREMMNHMAVVPFPPQDYLFVCFEIPERKYSKGQSVLLLALRARA